MSNTELYQDAALKVGGREISDNTIGGLIKYLKQFPPEWTIFVPDYYGTIRQKTLIHSENISTCLISKGEEVEF